MDGTTHHEGEGITLVHFGWPAGLFHWLTEHFTAWITVWVWNYWASPSEAMKLAKKRLGTASKVRGKWSEMNPNPNVHLSIPPKARTHTHTHTLLTWYSQVQTNHQSTWVTDRSEFTNRECVSGISDPPCNYAICCEARVPPWVYAWRGSLTWKDTPDHCTLPYSFHMVWSKPADCKSERRKT